jgi:hypothetical protein
VPREKLTVIMLHIPLASPDQDGERTNTADREELYDLLRDRPHTVSISAHRHWHGQFFHGPAEGWKGQSPHHHVIMGTLCGAWFRGAPDDRGVPHGTMADGTPRGYVVFDFADGRYSMDGYRVIGRRTEDQMHLDCPNFLSRDEMSEVTLSVNVYNGCDRTTVRCRVGAQRPWQTLEKVIAPDPHYVRMFEHDQQYPLNRPWLPMSSPRDCYHLWQGRLPADLDEGTHMIEVEATDMFGQTHHASRPLRITA